MNARQLKNALLQQAIEGRLVPQNPDDEPAAVLLQRIRAEKARLIEEGRIKKQKPLPPITDEEKPFPIPPGWEWVRLGEVALYSDAGWSPQAEAVPRVGDNWGVIKVSAVSSGVFREEENKQLYSGIEIPEKIKIKKGDFLISRANTSELVAQSCIVEYDVKNLILSDKTVRIYFSDNVIIKLISIINNTAMYIRNFYAKKATGTSPSMKNVSRETIFSVLLPLPPLEEQKRIVAKLEELLPEVEEYGRAQEELNALEAALPGRLRKSLLQEAVEGRLVPQNPDDEPAAVLLQRIRAEKAHLIKEGRIKKQKPLPPITDEEKPFPIPASWEWVRLGEVFAFFNGDRGKNYPSKDKLHEQGIPFVSAVNISNNTISKDKLLYLNEQQYKALNAGKLKKNDFIICIRGSLGKFAIYPFEKGAIASSLVILRPFGYVEDLPLYAQRYFISPLFFNEINRFNNGTAQPNLAAESLTKFLFPLPPLEEQKRIVAKLEEVLPLCAWGEGATSEPPAGQDEPPVAEGE